MVERDYAWKAAEYKFEFCEYCPFYECELINEYTHFKDAHTHAQEYDLPTQLIIEGREINIQPQNPSSKNVLSYDNSVVEDSCIMSYRHVIQIECGQQRVTEGIGEHFKIQIDCEGSIDKNTKDRWESSQPVFISAQTGQGKNYFIERTLIPYVRDLNYLNQSNLKILILSNRLALRQQIKGRIDGNDGLDSEEDGIYYYDKYADVMTYQSLLHKEGYLKKVQKRGWQKYIYVICDEAHFFTSDAMFNPHTQKILEMIVRLFQDAVRVYMSATPYDCLKYIIEEENKYQNILNSRKSQDKCIYSTMIFYHFKRNFDYLNIRYYYDISELYEKIADSVNQRKEKWLIFIDNKEKCAEVKKKLDSLFYDADSSSDDNNDVETRSEKVFAINADSKKDSTYQEIVCSEKLNKDIYILISTSVLDNGVNLNGIDNIVVSDMEKAKCLQMVGRARVDGTNDHKTLYIKRFDDSYVKKRLDSFETQKDAYHKYECGKQFNKEKLLDIPSTYHFLEKYYNGNEKDWENAKHWFGRSIEEPTGLYLNKIAKSILDRLCSQYQIIYDEMVEESQMDDGNQENRIGQKYLEHQLSWFGKTYCLDDDITFADKEKAKKEFIAFLEMYAKKGMQIDKGAQKEFKEKFTGLSDHAFGRKDRNRERMYSITKMNSILEEEDVNYTVISKQSYWVVEEYDWKVEESE